MRDAIACLLTRIADRIAGIRRPVPPAPLTAQVDPWTRPWTSPGKEEAQAFLRALEEARRPRTLPVGPPPRRRLYIAPQGIVLDRPVAVRTARPGPGWGWLR
ncbi:hypothetical protein [Streptomyces qinzhouensis]|uniref:Uncharacterized protein n=1 Tax=Streptomyces qinzhouensis TaxID=2599401 RepID=A0A5B8IJW3_9ACTN|nr:hypothetical protein [Streptomyces qinzhouensis]QDY78768.1 hypothetical protein FQU76_22165 [Streptomyces qinzhouensis]